MRHAARLLAEGHDPDAVAALTRVPRALLDLEAPLTGSPSRPAPALPAMPVPTTANRLEDHQTVLLIALRRVQRRRRAALAVGIGFGLNAGLALGAATSGQPQVAAASLLTTSILMALLWPCVRPTSCMAAGRTPRKRRGLLQT